MSETVVNTTNVTLVTPEFPESKKDGDIIIMKLPDDVKVLFEWDSCRGQWLHNRTQ